MALSLWQRTCSLLGFKKSYNAILFCIFGTILVLFVFLRFPFLFESGIWAAPDPPGEWDSYPKDLSRIGLTLHLGTVLPSGLLAVLQFIPTIRQKFRRFHRLNGRLIMILLIGANAGALMITQYTYRSAIEVQSAVVVLATLTTTSGALAYYNIRRLQIEQHRAWMLRLWFYLGSIITVRPVLISGIFLTSINLQNRMVWTCDEIDYRWQYLHAGNYLQAYPQCGDRSGIGGGLVPVLADIFNFDDPAQQDSAYLANFGMSIWVSLVIHMIVVEIYLHLTPREAARLRMESYKRQLAAGYENPGSAGLVPEKFGDADPWVMPARSDSR